MADLKQLAGVLNCQIYKGNTRDIDLEWDFDLTGYVFTARIVNADTDSLIVDVPIDDAEQALRLIVLKINDTVATATPLGTHKILVDWVDPNGLKRTSIAGKYEVTRP